MCIRDRMLGLDVFKELEEIDRWMDAHEAEFVNDISSLVRIPSVSVTGSGPYIYGKACNCLLYTSRCV